MDGKRIARTAYKAMFSSDWSIDESISSNIAQLCKQNEFSKVEIYFAVYVPQENVNGSPTSDESGVGYGVCVQSATDSDPGAIAMEAGKFNISHSKVNGKEIEYMGAKEALKIALLMSSKGIKVKMIGGDSPSVIEELNARLHAQDSDTRISDKSNAMIRGKCMHLLGKLPDVQSLEYISRTANESIDVASKYGAILNDLTEPLEEPVSPLKKKLVNPVQSCFEMLNRVDKKMCAHVMSFVGLIVTKRAEEASEFWKILPGAAFRYIHRIPDFDSRSMQPWIDQIWDEIVVLNSYNVKEFCVYVDLEHGPIGGFLEHYIHVLGKRLRDNKNVEKLYMAENNITGKLFSESFTELLRCNDTLQLIDLDNNDLRNTGLVAIAGGIETNRTLKHLTLSGNNISDRGVIFFADALMGNFSLQTVDLSSNRVSDEGIFSMAIALKANITLARLNLADNLISDNGARAISSALHRNIGLLSLNLEGNYGITAKGTKYIANALRVNKTLEELKLMHCLGKIGARAIANALKDTSINLREFWFRFEKISGDELTHENFSRFKHKRDEIAHELSSIALTENSKLNMMVLGDTLYVHFQNFNTQYEDDLATLLPDNDSVDDFEREHLLLFNPESFHENSEIYSIYEQADVL
eukprot:CAMPEP_0204825942 /NCGR_PEP_ID=MMETSP1346-20131115/3726_1 /ASSEMBLY_ACC=CAM_ASM_000771 /TAXON_ID=215587 /ORGANISM="Aplanochytrium stocchinoi, Strain GSBS06" /LENGTH=640 /DNA_ID=CAMNT_0051953747 /DNA_START=138 /DNA_END=2060 /DNA_ORIENTATION=+